jgi:membrane protein
VLFVAGKSLFSLYLNTSLTASAYGAAASLLVLLLWTYYSFQVLLLGFEVARVHAPPG